MRIPRIASAQALAALVCLLVAGNATGAIVAVDSTGDSSEISNQNIFHGNVISANHDSGFRIYSEDAHNRLIDAPAGGDGGEATSDAARSLLIVIRLYVAAGLPDDELAAAMDTTRDALRSAKLNVRWLVCAMDREATAQRCGIQPSRGELIVRITQALHPRSADPLGSDTLGSAAVDTSAGGGTFATIYVDRVERLAASARIGAGELVGHVMVHEIGHLLLGTTTHPRRGLMRAKWTSAELAREMPRDWTFSKAEAERLRSQVSRASH
ncbi:MAG: hypothetical protein IT176_13935 [Acidobacteria bacterium]|nr:hypothetical protein [Acidobacteriota bacterium]